MRILITADGEFTGSNLSVGGYYFCEKDDSGSLLQNSLFHALLYVYFVSGCFSYPVDNYLDLKKEVKRNLGVGFESYVYIKLTDKGLKKITVKNKEDIKGKVAVDEDGNKMIFGNLKSWSDYTRKERKETIDKLIAQMKMENVQSRKFNDILQTLERNSNNRIAA